MTTSCYWNWTRFALEVIEIRATQELKYLPPRHFCTVEYPVKLKNNAKWSDVYSRVAGVEPAGTLYVLACKVWDSTGSMELLATTFVVPSRDPGPNIDRFRAYWDEEMAVFIVESAEDSAEPGSAIRLQKAHECRSEEYEHGEDMFDVKCFSIEHDAYLEDQSQYDLGLFAVRETVPIRENSSKECIGGIWPGSGSGSGEVRDIVVDNIPKTAKNDCADDVEATIGRGFGPTQTIPTHSSSSQIGVDNLLAPESFGLVAGVGLVVGHNGGIENPLKQQVFDWADEVEAELENNRGKDFESLLKPESFNWADEVDVENGPLSPRTITLEGIDSVAGENSSGATDTSTKSRSTTAPRRTPDGPLIVSSDAGRSSSQFQWASSAEYTVEDNDCGAPAAQESQAASCEYYGQAQAYEAEWYAESEIAWQRHMTAQYPNIHHFNWLGQPVMERSHTTPEVSLFVILTGPKACIADTTRNGVVLKEAMKFIDPVLYAGPWAALSLRGHELLKAITGWTYPFYTAAGRWQEDPEDCESVDPVCDPTNPSAYATTQSIPFNGWYSAGLAPVRTQFWDAAAQTPSRSGHPLREHQPFQRSPLRKCTFAGSDEISSADLDRAYFVKGKVQYLSYHTRTTNEKTEEDSGSSSDSSQVSSPSTGRTTPVSDVGEQFESWRHSK